MGTGEGAVKRRAKASPPDSGLEIEDKTITLNVAATAKLAAELPKISVVADEESAGDYAVIRMRDDVAPNERLFAVTKHFLAHEMERGCKTSGVKRNRIHDIRHSHVSLLIEMGFSALAIAERMGHEAVGITYCYARLFPTKQDDMTAALGGVGDEQDPRENSVRKRSKTMAFRCTLEEHKLICEMAAWSGMNRQDYIIAKLTDTQVEVRPSVSVKKALRASMAELAKEVHLATSYGELSESLQQRIELVMRFFLVLGEGVDDSMLEPLQQAAPLEGPVTAVMDAESNTASIFEMGRGCFRARRIRLCVPWFLQSSRAAPRRHAARHSVPFRLRED